MCRNLDAGGGAPAARPCREMLFWCTSRDRVAGRRAQRRGLGDVGGRLYHRPVLIAPVPTRASYMRSPEAMRAELHGLAARFPDAARVVEIGRSVQGRPIEALVIGRRAADVAVPRVLFTGGVHARETANAPLLLDWASDLLTRAAGGDAARDAILGARTLLVVPSMNPDTAQTVWDGLGSGTLPDIWRRTNHGSGGGVDLNRNFPGPTWGAGSPLPGNSNYRGPAPASEPETRAVVEFASVQRPAAVYDIHSPGGVVLAPAPTTARSDATVAARLVGRITGYAVTTSDAHWNRQVGGTLKDWAHDVLDVPSLTIETGAVQHQDDAGYADTRARMFPALDALAATIDGRTAAP